MNAPGRKTPPRRKKPAPPPEPLPFKAVELQQRAENGGFPAANEDGFGHGTPVLLVDLRQFVVWLHRVNNAAAYSAATVSPGNHFQSKERPEWVEVHGGRAHSSYHQLNEIYENTRIMLKRWDNFVVPTSADEGRKDAPPTR